MVNRAAFVGLLSLALFASVSAQEPAAAAKARIVPAAKAADQRLYSLSMDMSIGGTDVVVRSDVRQTVDGVEGATVKETFDYQNFRVALNGAEMDGFQASPLKVERTLAGDLKKTEGGIPGTDAPRVHLFGMFVDPGKELGVGETAEVSFDGSSDKRIPARKYEITYQGEEKLGEATVWKYKVKYSEKEAGGMGFEITYWVSPDGVVRKADGSFTNMYIPEVGANASGTFKMELK